MLGTAPKRTAPQFDNQRSDPARQMRVGNMQTASGYGAAARRVGATDLEARQPSAGAITLATVVRIWR